ncbi:hypothetical protein AB835_08965 [Candidatus Endobugula sertula]|uniref:DUF4381 domain-containing protein n=1 Tax=Candidatus Endobugula sertula TaxID=62101 RepID=A0A1D2QP89_9GAMM|nr:hypothetical protein AB835_08965 [Candidatus Endobugula sertula]
MMTAPTELPLQDIHLPAVVNAWPPALGWWLLAFFCIVLVASLVLVIKRYRKKWGYRKAALHLLNQQYRDWQQSPEEQQLQTLQEMLRLLKRVAITAYPTENLSGLFGQAWISFLNRQTSAPYFDQTLSELMVTQQYLSSSTIGQTMNIQAVHHAIKQWINNHVTPVKTEAC